MNKDSGFRKAFGSDDRSLAEFLRAMAEFDRAFCDAMATGTDITLKMEVRGDKSRFIHARVLADKFWRPNGDPPGETE